MEGSAGASVIIRVRDEAPRLERCLGLLAGQRGLGSPVEVIVVDSESQDGSAAVAERAGARVVSMPATAFSFGGALNLGAEQARHEALVSLSAHAFPADDGWLARLVGALLRDGDRVACACGDRCGPDGERLDGAIAQDAALARRRPEWGYSNAAGAFRASLWRRAWALVNMVKAMSASVWLKTSTGSGKLRAISKSCSCLTPNRRARLKTYEG